MNRTTFFILRRWLASLLAWLVLWLVAGCQSIDAAGDPYRWLEDIDSPRALDWARQRNAESQGVLEHDPGYAQTVRRLLAIYDSRDRIPYLTRHGDAFYNFWQDGAHKRGILRRTSLAGYRRADIAWETVLDLDALAAAENENWTWKDMDCLGPAYRRCLVALARGGADATVVREFDVVAKRFVADGFTLPEAKSDVVWIDADDVYVATDFGPGSLTDAGYPRIVKRWRRGTPLAAASTVFEVRPHDVAAGVSVDRTPGWERTVFERVVSTRRTRRFLLEGDRQVPLDVPEDARIALMRDTLLIEPRTDLVVGAATYVAGSLLAADAQAFLAGDRALRVLFTPTATRSLAGWQLTRDHILLNELDDVASRLEEVEKHGAAFTRRAVKAPFPGSIGIAALYDPLVDGVPGEAGRPAVPASSDGSLAERYWFRYVDFLTPDSLALATAGSDARETLRTRPAQFNAAGMHVDQLFASSKDGTRIPYFVVWPHDRGLAGPAQAAAPTLLYGYGGFEISLAPFYSGAFGAEWYSAAASTCSPTSAAAASSGRPGTRPRSRPTSSAATTTSSPSPRT